MHGRGYLEQLHGGSGAFIRVNVGLHATDLIFLELSDIAPIPSTLWGKVALISSTHIGIVRLELTTA